MSACSTSPRSSESARRWPTISLTCSWLSTEITPNTRCAAFFASRFSRRLPTVPRSVIVPLFAETAIASLSTLGSQKSSSLTSAVRSLSKDIASSFRWVIGRSNRRRAAFPRHRRRRRAVAERT